MKHMISFILNGESVRVSVDSGERLLDLLRDRFDLTGTKEACGQGECGACTILCDGEAVHACLMLAVQADGTEIVTIEGLERNGELDGDSAGILRGRRYSVRLLHTGYDYSCQEFAVKKFLVRTAEEITEAMAGNLCRCTGYVKIHKAVESGCGKGCLI